MPETNNSYPQGKIIICKGCHNTFWSDKGQKYCKKCLKEEKSET